MSLTLPFMSTVRPFFAAAARLHIPPSRLRPFRTASLAAKPPTHPTVLLSSPSSAYVQQEELDVELPPPENVKLVITDRAAEVFHVRSRRLALTKSSILPAT